MLAVNINTFHYVDINILVNRHNKSDTVALHDPG